jgi:hypothetical protein
MKSLIARPWRQFIIAGCFVASFFATPLAAQVILTDWHTPGDNLLIVDQTAGLQFLSLQASVGRSANDVMGQFGVGGDYAGFRYATLEEVNSILTHLGVPIASDTLTPYASTFITETELNTFYSYFGKLLDYPGSWISSYGMIDGNEPDYGNRYAIFFAHEMAYGINPRNGMANYSESYTSDSLGHFLVAPITSAVPEPSTYAALLGASALGFVWLRRRKTVRP